MMSARGKTSCADELTLAEACCVSTILTGERADAPGLSGLFPLSFPAEKRLEFTSLLDPLVGQGN